jgi:hypothetical protein
MAFSTTKVFMHSGMTYSKRNGVLIVDNNAISESAIPKQPNNAINLNKSSGLVSFKKPSLTGRSRPMTGKSINTQISNQETINNPYVTERAGQKEDDAKENNLS